MKKARFTETEIVNILKRADSGSKVEDTCRQNGSSNATFYINGIAPFSSTESGFRLLLTSIWHQKHLRPKGLSAHNRLNNWTGTKANINIRFRLCRFNLSPFFNTLQLLTHAITLPVCTLFHCEELAK